MNADGFDAIMGAENRLRAALREYAGTREAAAPLWRNECDDRIVADVVRLLMPSVYTALLDFADGGQSGHVGVFSTEGKARAACQDHKNEDDEVTGAPKSKLDWKDDSAEAPDGDKYVVVMTTLDIPTGQG